MNPVARLFYRLGDVMAGGYDAGDSSRFRDDLGWGRQVPRDEDSLVTDSTRNLMRQKAADLRRNNPIVAGVCDRLALFTVGSTGIQPQARTSDRGWNRAAEQWWNQVYGPSCDSRGRLSLYQMQWMAVSLRPTHGGMFLETLEDGKVRPLECERIRNPMDGRLAANYVDGVKVDPVTGRIVSYRAHGRAKDGAFSGEHPERDVPAETMLRVTRPCWRPDQIREIPDLAPVIPALTDIHEMNKYALNTAKAQSNVIGFLKKEGGSGIAGRRGETTPTVGQRQTFKFEWGQILQGFANEDLNMKVSPTPGANHIPYVKMHYAICAAALGFPYEFLTLDLSSLDFSRQKGMLLLVNHACRPWKQWLVETMLAPLWNWRIAMEMGPGGALSPAPAVNGISEWARVDWQYPEEPWIDRQEAQQSDVLEIQAGLNTLSSASKRRGRDLEETLREKAENLQLVQELATEYGVKPEDLVKMQIPGQTESGKQKAESGDQKPKKEEPANGND